MLLNCLERTRAVWGPVQPIEDGHSLGHEASSPQRLATL